MKTCGRYSKAKNKLNDPFPVVFCLELKANTAEADVLPSDLANTVADAPSAEQAGANKWQLDWNFSMGLDGHAFVMFIDLEQAYRK